MRRRDFLKAALVVPFIPKKEELAVGKPIKCKKELPKPSETFPGYTIWSTSGEEGTVMVWKDGMTLCWDKQLSNEEVQSLYDDPYQMFKVIK